MAEKLILSRRTALLGAFSSVMLPSAALVSLLPAAEPLRGWDAVAVHAFTLQDALDALPERYWHADVWGGRDYGRIHVHNLMPGGGMHCIDRSGLVF